MTDLPRQLSRRLLGSAATALSVAGFAALAHAAPTLRPCGSVDGTVGIGAVAVDCRMARAVGSHYLETNHGSHGFRCRRYGIDAAAGWYAICSRARERVRITPE